jgi:hypothetical protein
VDALGNGGAAHEEQPVEFGIQLFQQRTLRFIKKVFALLLTSWNFYSRSPGA